jgi:hypothetical protein
MKTIASLLVCTALSLQTYSQSLASKTGEISLWNALAINAGIKPAELTKSVYKQLAHEYAQSVGLTYDGSFNGNIALLNVLPTEDGELTKSAEQHEVRTRLEIDTIRAWDNPRKQYALFNHY